MVKAAPIPAAQVVTANRLRDGAVVYLATTGAWSTRIAESNVAYDAAAAAKLLAIGEQAALDRVVVGPVLIEVALRDGRIQPLSVRERIRAFGPSVEAPVAGAPA